MRETLKEKRQQRLTKINGEGVTLNDYSDSGQNIVVEDDNIQQEVCVYHIHFLYFLCAAPVLDHHIIVTLL